MTRARAAAKANEPAVKSTEIVTAAAKAKSTATAGTRSTAAKRKMRADDTDDEDEFAQEEVAVTRKATRGRPRKLADPKQSSMEAATTTKTTRGRPAKKLASETSKAEAAGSAKALRGRPKKAVEAEPEQARQEPATKTTRGRSGTSRAGAAGAKPVVKKTVKFEEPDKENMAPQEPKKDSKKEPAAAGIRGRPARRGGATAARSTRKTTKSSEKSGKKPLSPKKVTQMPMQRDDESEDELAAIGHSPIKPMKKSPVKPPSSVASSKQSEPGPEERDDDASLAVSNAILNPPELGSTTLGSPARRVPPSAMNDLMKSPARKLRVTPFPPSSMKSATKSMGGNGQTSTSQSLLLLSAAKRPPSPIKSLNFSSPSKSQQTPSAFKSSMLQSPPKRAMPGLKPLAESPQKQETLKMSVSPTMKPLVMSTPSQDVERTPSEKLLMEQESPEGEAGAGDEEIFQEPITKIKFPGRLSAVLPRDADPSLDEVETAANEGQDVELLDDTPEGANAGFAEMPSEQAGAAEEDFGEQAEDPQTAMESVDILEETGAPMDTDEEAGEIVVALPPTSTQSSPEKLPSQAQNPNYQLREKDLNPSADLDMESDTELLSPEKTPSATPTTSLFKTGTRRSTIGLTSLAEQFGQWSAGSPVKDTTPEVQHVEVELTQTNVSSAEQTPAAVHFFEDEMQSRPETTGQEAMETPVNPAGDDEEPIFDEMSLKDEDFELAREADEMSKVGDQKAEESFGGHSQEDNLSDASQEYGDENQMPIDPAVLGLSTPAPLTPVRPQKHTFTNTTTKIPLKPADESTPSPMKKRAFSASRLPPQRSAGGLSRSATAPSLSPSKSKRASSASRRASALPPTTPYKSNDPSSALYTPGAREDVNPSLLRGAVVFVDVHTTEGADASGIFMELLTQMGARCRKTWDWNPSSPSGDASSNKFGITHIVYKDGGKRTLEKVRQTNGAVQCVGVSWVLE